MADHADLANDQLETALARVIDGRERYAGVSATECEACDDPIPEARRQAIPGVALCVFCQERTERQR